MQKLMTYRQRRQMSEQNSLCPSSNCDQLPGWPSSKTEGQGQTMAISTDAKVSQNAVFKRCISAEEVLNSSNAKLAAKEFSCRLSNVATEEINNNSRSNKNNSNSSYGNSQVYDHSAQMQNSQNNIPKPEFCSAPVTTAAFAEITSDPFCSSRSANSDSSVQDLQAIASAAQSYDSEAELMQTQTLRANDASSHFEEGFDSADRVTSVEEESVGTIPAIDNVVLTVRVTRCSPIKVCCKTSSPAQLSASVSEPCTNADSFSSAKECDEHCSGLSHKKKFDDRVSFQLLGKRPKHRRKHRPPRSGRKWKPVPDEIEIDLRMSLFPRTTQTLGDPISDLEESALQKEFEVFQETLQSPDQMVSAAEDSITEESKDSDENQDLLKVVETTAPEKRSSPVSEDANSSSSSSSSHSSEIRCKKKLSRNNTPAAEFFGDEDFFDAISLYEEKISNSKFTALECFSGHRPERRLRMKKKWRTIKAHVQIKTKHCQSVRNSVHGQAFYIHFRVMQRMSMQIEPRIYQIPLSLRRIDASKGHAVDSHGKLQMSRTESKQQTNSHNARAVSRSRFEMNAFNVDDDLSEDLVNVMMLLQHRDLLPEDYDLLLRLDDRVKPKTVDADILAELKTEKFVGKDGVGAVEPAELCAICMDAYDVGQTIKHLPCGHYFHDLCISNWLSNSSMNCPLDGMAVF